MVYLHRLNLRDTRHCGAQPTYLDFHRASKDVTAFLYSCEAEQNTRKTRAAIVLGVLAFVVSASVLCALQLGASDGDLHPRRECSPKTKCVNAAPNPDLCKEKPAPPTQPFCTPRRSEHS